jgi:hypothetical protein
VGSFPSENKVEPMDLANTRRNGVWSLEVACFGCRHEVIVNVDEHAGDLRVKGFGPRMVWTKCGMIGADVRPSEGTAEETCGRC